MSKVRDFAEIISAGITASDVGGLVHPEYDDDKIQTNLALLAFKTAVNGSLAKYNLQDQIVDEYVDATGVNTGDSTNEFLSSGVYSGVDLSEAPTGGDSTDTSVSGYTILVFTTNRALTVTTAGNVSVLVVGGGGSGGAYSYGGGGGAGGLVYDAVYAVTTNTYDAVIGDGGVPSITGVAGHGLIGGDSTFTINGGAMQFTAKGGGGGNCQTIRPDDGGSGGGNGYDGANSGGEYGITTQAGTTQPGMAGTSTSGDLNIGYNGGDLIGPPNYNPGGGGGAGGAGGNAGSVGGVGGVGYNASAVFGTAVGDGGWFASGGGGGYSANGSGGSGSASIGGGGAGGGLNTNGEAGQANTGGGSGGGGHAGSLVAGSGVVLVRYAPADFASYNNLTLQSTDTAAGAVPTKADIVIRMEDTAGTAALNIDIKAYISRDSGVHVTDSWTQATLTDEGDWGDGTQRILVAHDVSLTDKNSGQAMCYKITTHNQSASLDTRIHATSIGWK